MKQALIMPAFFIISFDFCRTIHVYREFPNDSMQYVCSSLVVKRMDSCGSGFESCTSHNKSTIDEKGNGKPTHKITSLEKVLIPVSGFC